MIEANGGILAQNSDCALLSSPPPLLVSVASSDAPVRIRKQTKAKFSGTPYCRVEFDARLQISSHRVPPMSRREKGWKMRFALNSAQEHRGATLGRKTIPKPNSVVMVDGMRME